MSFPQRMTIRSLGYTPGTLPPGPTNSILDVPGVHVSQSTVPSSASLAAGVTATKGVTIVSPRPPHEFHKPCAAGTFTLNGNGCLTGTSQIEDWGFTNTPIAFTNSLSLGTVFDGMWDWVLDRQDAMNWDGLTKARHYGTPVVGETADWIINSDVRASRLEKGDIKSAFEGLKSSQNGGAVREGQEGGGAGMTCHMFTGGTGTSSRVLGAGIGNKEKEYTVGVLCQSNYGHTTDLIIGGVPVGKLLEKELAAQAQNQPDDGAEFHAPPPETSAGRTKDGSILVLIITDAPFATHQLKRLARHATVGLASVGGHGIGRTFSGDIFLALSTAEDGPQQLRERGKGQYQHTETYAKEVVKNESIDAFFYAVAEATEEAVLNSLVGGRRGTVGVSGEKIDGLPVESVRGILEKHLVKLIMKYSEWKSLWHTCGGPTRDDLWTKYSHNRQAYNAAYFREETTIDSNLERGMAAFAHWEMKMIRQSRSQEQYSAGVAAARAFVEAVAAGEMRANADFVFVSIDFEGALGNRAGITEFGVAKLDTRDIVGKTVDASSPANTISGHNYLLAKCRKQRCMFGNTTRIDKPQLAATIKAELNIPDDAKDQLESQRRIVLVGHGLHNEQLILERHGIKLGDMDAVVGILDTSQYGMGGSLETLLDRLSLPLPRNRNGIADSLHCAGNDAHFTLRALLALLNLQHQEGTGRGGDVEILDRLARAPLPVRQPKTQLEDEEEDADLEYDLFVDSGFFDE
ncbi:hypothetical protein LTR10_009223 [Elasticomyces elasticus]|nr:hypothetical protein LTR10_009223 [Elasticomyces elasticus]KAK4971677.1 hypothetical protein LTR42_007405 [Elasticomyces elasticus]